MQVTVVIRDRQNVSNRSQKMRNVGEHGKGFQRRESREMRQKLAKKIRKINNASRKGSKKMKVIKRYLGSMRVLNLNDFPLFQFFRSYLDGLSFS